jgi:hypothetical protein
MVHARFGSKDAVLDAFFMTEYMSRLSPDLDPRASGLAQALAHFDRIADLYADDPEFLKAMFVAAFEAVKTTSPLRQRVRSQLEAGEKKVGRGLRKGVRDGSVRADINVRRAVGDISTAVFGIAYRWITLPEGYDFARELKSLRARVVEEYGTSSPC